MRSVAVAAVLADQPVLTQMLGFLQAAALAVKKGTVQGTVGVVNTRNTVCVLESFAAFLSGHQIALFHRSFLLQSFCCGCRARNACYCITQEKRLLLLFYPKIHFVFLCGCGTKRLDKVYSCRARSSSRDAFIPWMRPRP